MPANALVVNAGRTIKRKAIPIGNLNGTFLMIKNISTVNSSSYEVEMVGLKNNNTKASAKRMKVERA